MNERPSSLPGLLKLAGWIGVILLGVLLCMLVEGIERPKKTAREQAEREASTLLERGPSYLPTEKDPWGGLFRTEFQEGERVNVAVVASAGPDGEFDTQDDIVAIQRDYNKSRVVGEFVGSRATEVVKGVLQGLKNPKKHENR